MSNRLLILDTETTGLVPGKHVPLSVAAVDFVSKQSRYWEIEWPDMVVSPEAMRVNHWDFTKNEGRFCPCEFAAQFSNWLWSLTVGRPEDRLVIVGRNPVFDKQMIEMAFPERKWPFHYRTLDLNSIYLALETSGRKEGAGTIIKGAATLLLGKQNPEVHELGEHHAMFDAWRAFYELTLCHEELNK